MNTNLRTLLEWINKDTFIDCVVHNGELRIGTEEGNIRIPVEGIENIFFEKRNKINYWN
jgi:hypothetical protein